MPWIKIHEDGTVTPADDHWLHAVPSLDNGEWVFTLMAVERTLRQTGESALADRYKSWIDKLRRNVRKVFFDEKENAVRTQAHIPDIKDPDPQYSTDGDSYIRGPHGVYEGAMILDFMSLYADPPLSDEQPQKIWAQTKIQRVETPFGTTMQELLVLEPRVSGALSSCRSEIAMAGERYCGIWRSSSELS